MLIDALDPCLQTLHYGAVMIQVMKADARGDLTKAGVFKRPFMLIGTLDAFLFAYSYGCYTAPWERLKNLSKVPALKRTVEDLFNILRAVQPPPSLKMITPSTFAHKSFRNAIAHGHIHIDEYSALSQLRRTVRFTAHAPVSREVEFECTMEFMDCIGYLKDVAHALGQEMQRLVGKDYFTSDEQEIDESCRVCGLEGLKRCSRCKTAIYCSVECQRREWTDGHKVLCASLADLEDSTF